MTVLVLRAAAANNQKEDAPHLYVWWSLHCFRSVTRRCATFMAGESNDFFLVDVRRNFVWGKERLSGDEGST